MGIDIYLRWPKMTKSDKYRQRAAAFKTVCGETGYLREAYHGGPYATHIFFREAFESEDNTAAISAETLRERMDSVTEPVRHCDTAPRVAELIEQLVKAGAAKQFENTAAFLAHVQEELAANGVPDMPPMTTPMTGREAIYLRYQTVYPDEGENEAEKVIASFTRFIDLAERKEQATGAPCKIVASY